MGAQTLLERAQSTEDFFKASESDNTTAPGGSRQDTARNAPVPSQKADEDPQSLFWDPFSIVEQLGYKDKPGAVTYNTLRLIPWRMPIVQAIIKTRIDQVAAFSQVQHDRYGIGFKIKLRDSEKRPTRQDKKFIQGMESYLLRTGVTDNPRGRDHFEKFLRKVVYDSLLYDQMCWEIVPNKLGQPAEFYAVDATSIRLADTARTHMNEDLDDEIRYVQVYDSMIVTEYTQNQLAFGVRNPRTDMRLFGYGTSEVEMLIHTITALLYAWEYNRRFFSQGSTTKGILNFKGAINEKQFKAFRRHWYQMVSGVENSWRTPVTNAEDIQWVNMQANNRDMEFNAWMDFLIKVCCSVYAMDPSEVNFKYGNTGQSSAMSEENNRQKVAESKERGLQPLLRFISNEINQHLVWPINESFEFTFVGLDAMTREKVVDLNGKKVKTYRTVNELRAEDDLPPLEGGDIILDPVWNQAQAQAQAMAQQDQGQPGGEPDQGMESDATGEPAAEDDLDFEALLADLTGDDSGDEQDVEKSLVRYQVEV